MALQIWLPLNGNLNNQGLSGLKFSAYQSNTNTKVNPSGKIGYCYTNDSNTAGGIVSNKKINLGTKHSMFCWVKMTNFFDSSSLTGILGQHRFQTCQGMGITMKYVTSTTGYLSVNTGNGHGGRTYNTYCGTTLLNAGTWYHVGYTYDEGTIRLYVNGYVDGEHTYVSSIIEDYVQLFCWSFAETSVTNIIANNYKLKGFLNDVRIYDHCLSDKEVNEISKGLILHYKLSENYQTLNNSFNYPTFNTSSGHGGWSHWAPSNNTGTYSQNTNREYIYRDTQTYSHYFEHTSGANYYICYQSPAFEGGYRSAQAIIKMPNGEDPRGHVWFSHNANVGTNPPTTFTQLEDGFWLMKHEGFQQDGSNDLVSIGISHNKGVYVSEAYLENDKKVCFDIFNTNNNVIDCSGYTREGEIIGNLTTDSDTPRYDYVTSFDGASYIQTTSPTAEVRSVSFWAKWDSTPSGLSVLFVDQTSKMGFGLTSSSIICSSNGVSAKTFSKEKLTANKWNHFVIVNTGTSPTSTNRDLYINGVKQTPTSASDYWTFNINYLQVGKRSTASDGFVGSISDFRMYVTPLSSNDIKELYSIAVSIDNNGNLMCYMANEGNNGDSRELGPHIDPNSSNVVFNNDGSYTISGYTWPNSEYIPINPTRKTYYYDIEYSNIGGNQLYIGFERFDANKQSGSNSECQYVVATTGAADHKRIKGTVNLSTANGNTAAYTRLRILNDWKNTGNSTYKSTIHHISLKEVVRTNKVDVTKKGVFNCDNFIESSSASINNIGNVTCNQLIEI